MSSKSDVSKRLARLEESNRKLRAGTDALRTVVLRYGQHVEGCALLEDGTQTIRPCDCDWDSTRALIERGFTDEPKLVTL